MVIYILTAGYQQKEILSAWESRDEAIRWRRSYEAKGYENVKIEEKETADTEDEEWMDCFIGQIQWDFETYFIDNIFLDNPKTEIYKHSIKTDSRPKNKDFEVEKGKNGDLEALRVVSFISRDHCYELLNKEYEKLLSLFDKYQKQKKGKKR